MSLRVLQASAWYPPAHIGGTEVYVVGLVNELRAWDIDSRVILPSSSGPTDYVFGGTTVRSYPVNEEATIAELRGRVPHRDFSRFRTILEEERPDIYHQHSWTRGLGAAHLHAAREAGLKTVLTVHVANNVCMRGTMNLFGRETCDGRIEPVRCSACWSESRGALPFVARALAAIPPGVSEIVGSLPFGPSRALTALSARALVEQKKVEFARMVADADRVIAVCRWLYDALLLNGAPKGKVILNRQGVDAVFAEEAAVVTTKRPADGIFHVLYVGRWHPVKGVHILVRAARSIPSDVPFCLSIHAVGSGAEEIAYASEIRRLAEGDPRIIIKGPISRSALAGALAEADALAVPSLWLETGPLVVLEAKAAGLPVLGSRLGGIAELVREPDDGILVAPGDVDAWCEAIIGLAMAERPPTKRRRSAQVRSMRDVAGEMADLYQSLVGERH